MRSASRNPLVIEKERPLALALEQRIGGNRRAHFDGADLTRCDCGNPGQCRAGRELPRRGGIPIGFRVSESSLRATSVPQGAAR